MLALEALNVFVLRLWRGLVRRSKLTPQYLGQNRRSSVMKDVSLPLWIGVGPRMRNGLGLFKLQAPHILCSRYLKSALENSKPWQYT